MRFLAEAGTGALPSYTETLPRLPESVRRGRRFVGLVLEVWGMNDVQDAAELVASELLTNAVQHARRAAVRLTVTRLDSGRVRVAVVDLSRECPLPRIAGAGEESGRGLAIVDAASQGRWGVDPLAWGKRIWADLEAL
ncbi:ATP-binding protein [Streptomyces sp. NBC_01420]|uniref:ATP-binding protein n=1 Tax=Streptomyces sp. NBC_01420 TaxID=2903858 RepID=UPI00324E7329